MMAAPATPPEAKRKRPSLCHSCKRPVKWVLLEGKRTPLDVLEELTGNVAIEPELFPRGDGELALERARYISGVTTHYRRHIDSCPDADKWRDRWKRTAERPFSQIRGKKTR
jgi:hypothetical protein